MTLRVLPFARVALIIAGLWLVIPATGLAQGNGNGNGRPKAPKHDKPAPTPSPSPSPAPTSPSGLVGRIVQPPPPPHRPRRPAATRWRRLRLCSARSRPSGSSARGWTTRPPPRQAKAQTSVGIGHWRMNGMTQTNFPMIGMGLGVTDRLQISASLPFYHASYDGAVMRGIDDIYLSAKYVLVDPTLTLERGGRRHQPGRRSAELGGARRPCALCCSR